MPAIASPAARPGGYEARPKSESAPLGISAKSIHAGSAPKSAKTPAPPHEIAARRRNRLELTRAAGSILFDPKKTAPEQHRTVWCNRTLRNESRKAGVYRAVDGSSARLQGVTTCGSVWACPTCAARIAEERRRELQHALVAHVEAGGAGYLITLTNPHERDEFVLPEMLERQAKALQSFKNSRTYKRILGTAGTAKRKGSVRGLESTHGRNGWHPHVHELAFCKRQAFNEGEPGDGGRLQSDDIEALRGAWVGAIVKHGLCPDSKISWAWQYAFDLRGGDKAAEYIAKFGRDERWGAATELTENLAKLGKRTVQGEEHRTPFQILADAHRGDARSWHLFREYALAFEGKRQLTWSPGLKKTLGVLDRDDDEIAADDRPKPEEQLVGELDLAAFSLITSRQALGEFIEFVALCCDDVTVSQGAIDSFLAVLLERPRKARGSVQGAGGRFYSDDDFHIANGKPVVGYSFERTEETA